jgi:NAD(P)-dependent dehydrogenase (short-subunit alcohol dehydrogenase family)
VPCRLFGLAFPLRTACRAAPEGAEIRLHHQSLFRRWPRRFGLRSPYAAAKWAVIGFTKSLAIELGPQDVRVNAICPGTVEGDRMNRVIDAETKLRGASFEQVKQEYIAGQSIKRFVDPKEIADLCIFLASPAAKMITGQAIAVDGHTETYHLG